MNARGVLELTDQNFDDEVYGHGDPVLVECWSERSYACRELSDIIDDLADEYQGKVKIGRLNVDANWQTAEAFGVHGTPVVLLFQHERVVDRLEGPQTRAEYRQALNELITQYWVI